MKNDNINVMGGRRIKQRGLKPRRRVCCFPYPPTHSMEGESVIIKLVKITYFCILSIICAIFASYYLLLGRNIGVVAFIAYIVCAVKAINIISCGRR